MAVRTFYLGQAEDPVVFIPLAELEPSGGCGIFEYTINGDPSGYFHIHKNMLYLKKYPYEGEHAITITLKDPLNRSSFDPINIDYSLYVDKYTCIIETPDTTTTTTTTTTTGEPGTTTTTTTGEPGTTTTTTTGEPGTTTTTTTGEPGTTTTTTTGEPGTTTTTTTGEPGTTTTTTTGEPGTTTTTTTSEPLLNGSVNYMEGAGYYCSSGITEDSCTPHSCDYFYYINPNLPEYDDSDPNCVYTGPFYESGNCCGLPPPVSFFTVEREKDAIVSGCVSSENGASGVLEFNWGLNYITADYGITGFVIRRLNNEIVQSPYSSQSKLDLYYSGCQPETIIAFNNNVPIRSICQYDYLPNVSGCYTFGNYSPFAVFNIEDVTNGSNYTASLSGYGCGFHNFQIAAINDNGTGVWYPYGENLLLYPTAITLGSHSMSATFFEENGVKYIGVSYVSDYYDFLQANPNYYLRSIGLSVSFTSCQVEGETSYFYNFTDEEIGALPGFVKIPIPSYVWNVDCIFEILQVTENYETYNNTINVSYENECNPYNNIYTGDPFLNNLPYYDSCWLSQCSAGGSTQCPEGYVANCQTCQCEQSSQMNPFP